MKKSIKIACMLMISTLLSTLAFAQENETEVRSTPRWISDKGYWIIESNIKTPKTSLVYFYNTNDVLIYSEKVEGVRVNIKRPKTCMRLKKALDQSLIAWEKMQHRSNEQFVKNSFKLKK